MRRRWLDSMARGRRTEGVRRQAGRCCRKPMPSAGVRRLNCAGVSSSGPRKPSPVPSFARAREVPRDRDQQAEQEDPHGAPHRGHHADR